MLARRYEDLPDEISDADPEPAPTAGEPADADDGRSTAPATPESGDGTTSLIAMVADRSGRSSRAILRIRQAGAILHLSGHCEGSEHDSQVGFDGIACGGTPSGEGRRPLVPGHRA